jgi:branched-chain amino acid transport system permease protein
VIASIIGGVGNIYGGVLGSFLLGFIENFGIWKISGEWKDAISFGVLLLFFLLLPPLRPEYLRYHLYHQV